MLLKNFSKTKVREKITYKSNKLKRLNVEHELYQQSFKIELYCYVVLHLILCKHIEGSTKYSQYTRLQVLVRGEKKKNFYPFEYFFRTLYSSFTRHILAVLRILLSNKQHYTYLICFYKYRILLKFFSFEWVMQINLFSLVCKSIYLVSQSIPTYTGIHSYFLTLKKFQ